MDISKKKAGVAIVCAALIVTMGTGFAFAAKAETNSQPEYIKEDIVISPWISVSFIPNPDIYAPYAAFGITISEDGTKLLYEGQPVRQFVDEKVADGQAFYLDEAGGENLSVVRNAAGEITGIERITAQKAQEYYEVFFAEELDDEFLANVYDESVQDLAEESSKKYEKYQPFGITYSATDAALYFNGQRVKFFADQNAYDEWFDTLWKDAAGTVNLAVIRDASGQITGIETISDEKAQELLTTSEEQVKSALDGLDEKIAERMKERFPE